MAKRLMSGIPIWVRVPGIIALVLVAVLIGTTLLGAAEVGGGHGRSGDETEMSDHNGDAGRGGGDHGSGDETETSDHNGDAAGGGGSHGSGDETETRDHE